MREPTDPFTAALAELPDLIAAILRDHVPDAAGRCRACGLPGTGTPHAEAGIRQYWILDLDAPTSLVAYILVNGDYELSGEHTGAAELDVAGYPISIDLPALTRR